MAGIEPTGRGVPVPLVLKTREATRPRSPPEAVYHARASRSGRSSGRLLRVVAAPTIAVISAPVATNKGNHMKKLLIILILAAIGIAVAKKVREA